MKLNNKEKRDLQISWNLVGMAAIIAFFVNISASSCYELLTQDFRWKILGIFITSSLFSLYITGFFYYTFERLDELEDESVTFNRWMWNYTKSIFSTKFMKKNKKTSVDDKISNPIE